MDLELKLMLFPLLTPLASIAAFAPVVLYIVARWRANREPAPDPQLGLKFALYYFATLAFQLVLVGVTLLGYTMIRPGGEDAEPKGDLIRMAMGFVLPAGAVLGAHIALLVRTNDRQFPAVRRLFVGFNLLLVGLVGFAALVGGAQAAFARGSSGGMGHLAGAGILVYCSAWGLLAWAFQSMVSPRSYLDGGGPPEIVPPPGSPQPPQPPAGGGLPSLGGGAYPPIEPR